MARHATQTVEVTLSKDTLQRLEEKQDQYQMTRAALIRVAVGDLLAYLDDIGMYAKPRAAKFWDVYGVKNRKRLTQVKGDTSDIPF